MGSIGLTRTQKKTFELKVSSDGKTLTPTAGGSAESTGIVFPESSG